MSGDDDGSCSDQFSQILIRHADAQRNEIRGLADVLIDCVEGGASVGFMLPLSRDRAEAFWSGILQASARGERIVFVAEDSRTSDIVGTVHVVLAAPENQPHRGEISKMLVRRDARGCGVADALMQAAEAAAQQASKTLLVLDTASPEAERLYERRGWQRAGVIPDYALWPDGGFVDAVFFYKHLPG